MEMQLILTVFAAQIIFWQLEIMQPIKKLRLENLLASVEAVTRQPDHLFFGKTQRACMIELRAQLAFIDLIGKTHRGCAVDERKGRIHLGVKPPDHLQHQKFVEIRVQKAANNRIKLPCVIKDAPCDIGFGHDGLHCMSMCCNHPDDLQQKERRVFTRLFKCFIQIWEALQ